MSANFQISSDFNIGKAPILGEYRKLKHGIARTLTIVGDGLDCSENRTGQQGK